MYIRPKPSYRFTTIAWDNTRLYLTHQFWGEDVVGRWSCQWQPPSFPVHWGVWFPGRVNHDSRSLRTTRAPDHTHLWTRRTKDPWRTSQTHHVELERSFNWETRLLLNSYPLSSPSAYLMKGSGGVYLKDFRCQVCWDTSTGRVWLDTNSVSGPVGLLRGNIDERGERRGRRKQGRRPKDPNVRGNLVIIPFKSEDRDKIILRWDSISLKKFQNKNSFFIRKLFNIFKEVWTIHRITPDIKS